MNREHSSLIFIAKKTPSKPVESLKPRTRADFEEFRQLLTDLILQHSVSLNVFS